MSIAILLQQILIIFLEIGTGAAVTKLGIMDDRNSKFLSNLVMSVTLPCTLLASASIDGGREAVAGMLKGYVVLEIFYILTIGICLVLSRAMHLTRGQKAVLVGAAVMPNSAFIGIPLISALLGSEAGALYGAAGIMAYNILFFTYVQHLFDPEAKVSIKAFLTPTNITTAIMVVTNTPNRLLNTRTVTSTVPPSRCAACCPIFFIRLCMTASFLPSSSRISRQASVVAASISLPIASRLTPASAAWAANSSHRQSATLECVFIIPPASLTSLPMCPTNMTFENPLLTAKSKASPI